MGNVFYLLVYQWDLITLCLIHILFVIAQAGSREIRAAGLATIPTKKMKVEDLSPSLKKNSAKNFRNPEALRKTIESIK